MQKITFDSNIFINHRDWTLTQTFFMSAVVLQELVAGARDASALKELERSRHGYLRTNTLLVPSEEDWWQAGLILNAIQRGRRSKKSGRIPKISAGERYRIVNDVLIARTAKRAGVAVVTDNVRDFRKIQNFCNVKIISGSKYFGNRDALQTDPDAK